jgi:hypothetical protein
MPGTQYQSPINRILGEAFNQGNLPFVEEVLTPDHFAHNSFYGSLNGPTGMKWLISMLRTAFPDLHCTDEDEIGECGKFAVPWTMLGTHKGSFLGNLSTCR